jgi:glycosyltransferase involved in cell wall biosynthesis
MIPVTVWMNMPSFYQDDLFRQLARRVELRVVYDHAMTEDRRQLGWAEVKSDYRSCILDRDRKIRQAINIARSERDRIHIINGIWAESAFTAVAFALGELGVPFAIYSECPDLTVSRSWLSQRARVSVGHWVARRARALFAISHLASDYFGSLGFAKDKIYLFGYFRASPEPVENLLRGDGVDIVCLGQLIHRKGLDILLRAVRPLLQKTSQIRLSLIGTGPEQASIVAGLRQEGLLGSVELEGPYPSSGIHERLARASLLVLPSRWDGWGLVINEAFAAGVPVIVSDRCGAADLILQGVNGYRFRSESVEDLQACLSAFLASDQKQMRAAALRTASMLAIPVVSDYLVACLEHMCGLRTDRPEPPWEQMLRSLEPGDSRLDSAVNSEADPQAVRSTKV